ncbi:MAG: hypothetical protein ACFFGP_01915, partial [Promethearchaeota archaeon]
MVENKRVINSDYIVKFFGLNSQIYKEEVEPLLKKKVEKGFKLQEKFNGFKTLFRKVYGLELSYDLFIK